MITFACPTCRKTLQATEDQVGRMISCPQCRANVQIPVPINQEGSSSSLWIILAVVGAGFLAIAILFCLGAGLWFLG